jgi:hypothetical protein
VVRAFANAPAERGVDRCQSSYLRCFSVLSGLHRGPRTSKASMLQSLSVDAIE